MSLQPLSFACIASLALLGMAGAGRDGKPPNPPEVEIGERLFRETRFAEFFARQNGDAVNRPLSAGDRVLNVSVSTGPYLTGPYAGQSMNCAACHLVDEQARVPGAGMRTYADFARRSPVPFREDGQRLTPRNSPQLVGIIIDRPEAIVFHFDGEFATLEALVAGTLTGRNYGWLPAERAKAVVHIASVIRKDDGTIGGSEEEVFFGAYRIILAGASPVIPVAVKIPPAFRIDVDAASDEQILAAVSRLIAAYVKSLQFARDGEGRYIGSPYDVFLAKNGLPRSPKPGETDLEYSRRLRAALGGLQRPRFLTELDGRFRHHQQEFQFGEEELAGLSIFLAEPESARVIRPTARTGVGNCVACHPAPHFTDFSFHNTGESQREYDAVHGRGAFSMLAVPSLSDRLRAPQAFLPAASDLPDGKARFRAPPERSQPGQADLGAWNVCESSSLPESRDFLCEHLCRAAARLGQTCSGESLLSLAVGAFKTPGLRDLGHSGPYLHSGALDTFEDVLLFYMETSEASRRGLVRNADPEVLRMDLEAQNIEPLRAFLSSLNEDYE